MTRTATFAVDRIEGTGAEARVVLIADADGSVREVARGPLGRLAVEGAVLRAPLAADGTPTWDAAVRDRAEEARRRAAAKATMDRLRRGDPGGDLTL